MGFNDLANNQWVNRTDLVDAITNGTLQLKSSIPMDEPNRCITSIQAATWADVDISRLPMYPNEIVRKDELVSVTATPEPVYINWSNLDSVDGDYYLDGNLRITNLTTGQPYFEAFTNEAGIYTANHGDTILFEQTSYPVDYPWGSTAGQAILTVNVNGSKVYSNTTTEQTQIYTNNRFQLTVDKTKSYEVIAKTEKLTGTAWRPKGGGKCEVSGVTTTPPPDEIEGEQGVSLPSSTVMGFRTLFNFTNGTVNDTSRPEVHIEFITPDTPLTGEVINTVTPTGGFNSSNTTYYNKYPKGASVSDTLMGISDRMVHVINDDTPFQGTNETFVSAVVLDRFFTALPNVNVFKFKISIRRVMKVIGEPNALPYNNQYRTWNIKIIGHVNGTYGVQSVTNTGGVTTYQPHWLGNTNTLGQYTMDYNHSKLVNFDLQDMFTITFVKSTRTFYIYRF